jgi:diguanylate cyclase (GGDEF)-like protein/PAS domain S-box-containing protein
MRASILRHQIHATAARPVDDARVLRAVGEIMAGTAPGHTGFFESLAERCVLEMGADGAWVYLHGGGDAPAQTFFSKSCHVDDGSDPSAASAAVHALLSDGVQLYLDERSACLPQAPWFACFGAGTCVAHSIFGSPGAEVAVAGHLALVFRARLEHAESYVHALQALTALARHEVQDRQRRHREVDSLRETVAQYEAVFQTAPVLVNVFGDDGKCLLWNEECERRFGWSMEEVNAHPEPLALFYPDPLVRSRVQASVSDEPSRIFLEWYPRTRSGEVLTTIWSNTRMSNGRVINIGLDITERKRAEADIVRLSRIDSLTGCWSRAEIMARLTDRLAAANRGGAGFTAMMLDLDHFKRVNDCHGHLEGDAALRHFCEQLLACLREDDALGRLGGEEFLVLLGTADARAGCAVFERLRVSLRAQPLPLGGMPVVLSASAGIAVFGPGDVTATDVLKRADVALYQAKRQGRDQAVVHLAGA